MSELNASDYQPGVCNIGKQEIAQRRRVAIIGAVATLVLCAALLISGSARSTRLYLFIPAMMASIGWVQSRRKFCLAFGFMGTFNFGKLGQLSKISDPVARKADLRVAVSILLQGLALALVVTLVIYLLPA